mgnify:FL=1
MEIRKAQEGDIPALISLLEQVLAVHHEIRPDLFKERGTKYSEKELASMLADSSRPIFVLEDDGRVIGHAFVELRQNKETRNAKANKELYLDDLVVDRRHQGKGYGKALYTFVRDFAKQNGCDYITLNVWEGNEARKFYESLGLVTRKTTLEERL